MTDNFECNQGIEVEGAKLFCGKKVKHYLVHSIRPKAKKFGSDVEVTVTIIWVTPEGKRPGEL